MYVCDKHLNECVLVSDIVIASTNRQQIKSVSEFSTNLRAYKQTTLWHIVGELFEIVAVRLFLFLF